MLRVAEGRLAERDDHRDRYPKRTSDIGQPPDLLRDRLSSAGLAWESNQEVIAEPEQSVARSRSVKRSERTIGEVRQCPINKRAHQWQRDLDLILVQRHIPIPAVARRAVALFTAWGSARRYPGHGSFYGTGPCAPASWPGVPQTAQQYAEWFRALADPTRVQIIAWLAAQPEAVSVGELTAVLPVGQSTVSHHLAACRRVGGIRHCASPGNQLALRGEPALLGVLPERRRRRHGTASTGAPSGVRARPRPRNRATTMTDPSAIREAVRDRYAAAAALALQGQSAEALELEDSCCTGPTASAPLVSDLAFGSGLYDADAAAGAPQDALAASLGCGVSTAVVELHAGETVLDLGSGAGAEVLISARRVGPVGRVIGLDMTTEMLELARRNSAAAGATNVEFLQGYLEDIPLPDASVDVVISNCVINLATDKAVALAEAARVLRPGGRLAISDVLADPDMDEATREDMAAWTGCIAGALTREQFVRALSEAGLSDIAIQETHRVHAHASAAIVRARKPESGA